MSEHEVAGGDFVGVEDHLGDAAAEGGERVHRAADDHVAGEEEVGLAAADAQAVEVFGVGGEAGCGWRRRRLSAAMPIWSRSRARGCRRDGRPCR